MAVRAPWCGAVAIEADQAGFQHYKSGVFNGPCGTKIDHGVLVRALTRPCITVSLYHRITVPLYHTSPQRHVVAFTTCTGSLSLTEVWHVRVATLLSGMPPARAPRLMLPRLMLSPSVPPHQSTPRHVTVYRLLA